VRIAHGIGTGALRNAIRGHLRDHRLVKSFGRDEARAGDGATAVEL
jgi:dsDNA-specific endonuclease/ATPase MutS2